MDDPEARFVVMLMDRLQAMEVLLRETRAENEKLSKRLCAAENVTDNVKHTLYVMENNRLLLSDGLKINWNPLSLHPGHHYLSTDPHPRSRFLSRGSCIMPVDDLHASVVMAHGPVVLFLSTDQLQVGADDAKTVTVAEVLSALDAWARKPYRNKPSFRDFWESTDTQPIMEMTSVGIGCESDRVRLLAHFYDQYGRMLNI